MSDCEPHIEIHKTAGCTQTGRMIGSLKTDFVKIDERKIKDLILLANNLSSHIKFYNSHNAAENTWNSFFQWEATSILAQVAALDVSVFITGYELLKRRLLFITDDSLYQQELLDFFISFQSTATELFAKVDHLPRDIQIKEYFNSTYPTIKGILIAIINEIESADDVKLLPDHHLFNKKIHNVLGLLQEWKAKSDEQLYNNLSSYPRHSPHYALYLAFLKLFEKAQEDLNTFTKKHLDFYYKDILHLAPEPGISDYVHCCFEPHKNVGPFAIEKGAAFVAGKDSEGKAKYYTATADSTINQAKIGAIYGGYKVDGKYQFEELTETNASGESWQAFKDNAEEVQLGLALASPLFFLRGGQRTIRLFFNKQALVSAATDPNMKNTTKAIYDNYEFYLSGEKKWLKIDQVLSSENHIDLTVPVDEVPIVPFDLELHPGVDLDTPFPVLKMVNKDRKYLVTDALQIKVEIEVENYKQFQLYSNTGLVDHTKSFQPFGAFPKSGNSLVFSCNEFFQKKNAEATFNIALDAPWNTLFPNSGTKKSAVEAQEAFVRSSSSTAPAALVKQGAEEVSQAKLETSPIYIGWNLYTNTKLERLEDGNWEVDNNWKNTDEPYHFKNTVFSPFHFTDNPPLTPDETQGFARFVLTDPNYAGEKYLETFIAQAKEDNPNLPYVPTIDSISLNYTVPASSDQVDFFHLYPIGSEKLASKDLKIAPDVQNEGELFIGIADVEPGNVMSLLFQVAEGTANPRQVPIELKWSYLHHNRWEYFDVDKIGDESNGLTQSGIVQVNAPENLDIEKQSKFPPNMWWIKIEVLERVDAICHLVGIHAQALKAVLDDFENTGVSFEENLAAKTISKLYRPKNQIKKIEQPYASFGGKVAETSPIFYQRTSERLRHKDKAICSWDYEKLVLDNFPEVYRVKCLNHYRYDTASINGSSSGYVTIIPVAQGVEQDIPTHWKPIVDLGTMKRIKTLLDSKTTPHVRINVKPPKLEQLDVHFEVKYHEIPGADSRLYTQQLKDIINAYLSPWAYNAGDSISFQTEIEKSELIHLIESQSYVDYISEFRVDHLILAETSDDVVQKMSDVEKIIPKTPYSLFVPLDHSIVSITNPCCV